MQCKRVSKTKDNSLRKIVIFKGEAYNNHFQHQLIDSTDQQVNDALTEINV